MRQTVAVLVCLVVLGGSAPAAAQDAAPAPDTTAQPSIQDEAKADSIRTLVRMTQAGRIAKQIFNRVLRIQKKQHPEVPERWWKQARQHADIDGLIDRIIPIYAKHFTQKEINQLLDFYRSPVGKKVIEKMPTIMQESMMVGQEWGKKLRKQLIEQLKADGYLET
jgi:hypothetical protein